MNRETLLALLPCPFCGCEAWMECHGSIFQGARGYRVECQGKCHAMTCYWHERAQAVEAWNTRALQSPIPGGWSEAIEAAAKVAEDWNRHPTTGDPHETSANIAAAIRNIPPPPGSDKVERAKAIVELYFAPWGAAKGEMWEDVSGDQPFEPEVALKLVLEALSPPSPVGVTDGHE